MDFEVEDLFEDLVTEETIAPPPSTHGDSPLVEEQVGQNTPAVDAAAGEKFIVVASEDASPPLKSQKEKESDKRKHGDSSREQEREKKSKHRHASRTVAAISSDVVGVGSLKEFPPLAESYPIDPQFGAVRVSQELTKMIEGFEERIVLLGKRIDSLKKELATSEIIESWILPLPKNTRKYCFSRTLSGRGTKPNYLKKIASCKKIWPHKIRICLMREMPLMPSTETMAK